MTTTPPPSPHVVEDHRSGRAGWLRAAVLGANDGIVSTAGLVIGVAAADSSRAAVFTAGMAGLVAGAMSMAAGEYVSVGSQRDAERADELIESGAIEADREAEVLELANIYEQRGVEPTVAQAVAEQLMAQDPVGAHLRDELGISETTIARPWQAAYTSALAFGLGGALPLLAILLPGRDARIPITAVVVILALLLLGVVSARLGGARVLPSVVRIVGLSSLAMLLTYAVGTLVGAQI